MNRNTRKAMWAVLIVPCLAGCGSDDKPDKDSGRQDSSGKSFVPNSETLVAEHNRGVGLMEQFKYGAAVDVFGKLVERHPNWVDAIVNLAIATANDEEGGAEAIPILDRALKIDPNHARATYCKGALLVQLGQLDDALPCLKKTVELDAYDAYSMYLIGSCIENDSAEEALKWFEKAIQADPYFYNPHYRCSQLYGDIGKPERAAQCAKEAQRLRTHPLRHELTFKYTQMGPKALCTPIKQPGAKPPTKPSGPLFQLPQPLSVPEKLTWNKFENVKRPPSITSCDINGDGRVDLFLAGAITGEANLHNCVLLQNSDGSFSAFTEHPIAAVSEVNAALWGDFDNDGLTDVYLCRRGPNQLWRQANKNQWLDVTEQTKTSGGDFDSVDGAMFDADHDADLDIFLVNADGPNELLNNNLDGTFQPIAVKAGIAGDGRASHSVLIADLDRDRDRDIIVLNEKPPHEVYLNDRAWQYRPAEGFDKLVDTDIDAAVCGDLVIDGQVEIYALSQRRAFRWQPDEKGEWNKQDIGINSWPGDPEGRLALADVTGDGALELLAGSHAWWEVYSLAGGKAKWIPAVDDDDKFIDLATQSWSVVNLDHKSGPSVIAVRVGEAPRLARPGPGRHPFLTLTCKGKQAPGSKREKSNASGIGARIEVRVGSRLTVADYVRWQSGRGQSLQPLAIGLGGAARADFVRATWTDGISQSELHLAPNQLHTILEMDRLPSSCPLLFAWNGERYQFVSDVLAVGGQGYFVAPGEYAVPDPTESFLLPENCLAPRDGVFDLKLTEPMQELTYLDSASLLAYDLPPGWRMTLDERLATAKPQPTGQAKLFRIQLQPSLVMNERGEDVTSAVRTADLEAAPVGKLDRRFHGRLADEHVLHLKFEKAIDNLDGLPTLIADGWVEFPYSQTMFAAWQAGADFDPPTLEARGDDGRWQTVLERFGYPGGMPRQLSAPLENLPKGTKELRLRTNLEIYWDRLTIAFIEPCEEIRVQRMPLKQALLRESGFTPRIVLEQQRPHFEYDQRVPLAVTLDPAGLYTRFGRVAELVTQTDNALAIFGPGEEIQLQFSNSSSPLPPGWQRRYVLQLVGWCKDMDLYTGHGETVEPLPFQHTLLPRRDKLHQQFNTRYQHGR